jgi:hypothetical protein
MEESFMPTREEMYDEFVANVSHQPPVACKFEVGDVVTFTNDYDVEFPGCVVLGFSNEVESEGRFVHLDMSCWWFPVKPSSLRLEHKARDKHKAVINRW